MSAYPSTTVWKAPSKNSVQWQVNDQFGYDANPYLESAFGGGNYLGSNFDFLTGKYKDLAEGNIEAVDAFRDFGVKQAGQTRGRGLRQLEELGAQSGFSGSVNMNLMNQLFEQEATGIGQTNVQAMQMEQGVRERALAGLMGLNEFEGKTNLGVDQFKEGIRQYDINTEEGRKRYRAELALGQRNYEMQKDAQSGSFGSFLGSALGTGIGFAFGGAGAGIGNWAGGKLGGWLENL